MAGTPIQARPPSVPSERGGALEVVSGLVVYGTAIKRSMKKGLSRSHDGWLMKGEAALVHRMKADFNAADGY